MTLSDIEAAHNRIKKYIHKTPVLTSRTLDELVGAKLYFKCENFQKVGAFKFRGAANAVFSLTDTEAKKGVATHSSGNHGQALALAAKMRGIPAYIVMPRNAPEAKKKATAGYDGKITYCEPNLKARETALEQIVNETGAYFIHPYDNPTIIAGQGTATLEFLQECPFLDVIMAPVGGGGLLSGTGIVAKSLKPTIQVIGAEPEVANDAFKSLKDNKRHSITAPQSIADGLLASLSDLTFSLLKQNVDQIMTASEDEIKGAMRWIWERMKIIIEPSSAVPLAALLARPQELKNKNIGIILSGGNVDFSLFLVPPKMRPNP